MVRHTTFARCASSEKINAKRSLVLHGSGPDAQLELTTSTHTTGQTLAIDCRQTLPQRFSTRYLPPLRNWPKDTGL
jgi:hypothetical protein